MTLNDFTRASGLNKLSEIERACYLAFFYLKIANIHEFNVADVAKWLVDAGGATPNTSRLEVKLRASSSTLKAPRGWRLKTHFVHELEDKFPHVSPKSQAIEDDGTVIPEIDYTKTRTFIESLARQVNKSYESNVFDGCAVLMRRLLEVMLILSYRNLKIDTAIQDGNGNYLMLEGIVKDAKANSTLALSRNSKNSLDRWRELGNYSAHRVEYLCRREYIAPHIQEYRALFVELLYKSGIHT